MSAPDKAVFLSYASQDAAPAKRIAEALRAAGVEVWFDQSELVGGDAWDQKIRQQIRECALLIPVISATTQGRREAYFRLEWKLADERTHLMAKGTPFLLPVTIDDTSDRGALVPDSFLAVQWTRLPGGETPPAFAQRVSRLLSGAPAVGPGQQRDGAPTAATAINRASPARRWLWPVLAAGGIGLAALAFTLFSQRSAHPTVAPAPAAPAGAPDIARLRARIFPDRWQKGDFEAIAPALDRLLQANPEDADAWALSSIVNSLQVVRLIDPGTKPLENGKNAAERALRLSPESPLAHLARGLHLVAMMSRGGDPLACRGSVDRAVAALPPDSLTRYVELVSYWLGYDFEATDRIARAWLEAEPAASFPAWILVSKGLATRQPAEMERWAKQSVTDPNITGIRTLLNLTDMSFYLRADLPASRAMIDRVPAPSRSNARVVHLRWEVAMAEGRWDAALQELALVPDAMLFDVAYNGPKAFLAGQAHLGAGRREAALVQFREAERLLREALAADPDNEALRVVLAATLALAGRGADARNELALVEPLVQGRAPNVYRARLIVAIAQAYLALGDHGPAAFWLRKLFAEPSSVPLTPRSLQLDPRFRGAAGALEIQTLLQEFAALDQPVAAAVKPEVSLPIDQKSVAVLAFANLSEDKGNEYFSEGISEELLNVLAKIPGLKVSARTSAFYFKGKEVPIPEIARQLGVAYVVEGSVRKAGDKVRITAQLIKADGGFHVWSDTFTRDLKDIFAVQDEIAALIAQNLKLGMGLASPGAHRAVNPEAHQLLLEGRHFWNLRTMEGFDRAEAAFSKAIKLDPDFAQAHAGLADVRWVRTVFNTYAGINYVPANYSGADARRALALDPTLAEAYPAAAAALQWAGRAAEAEQLFLKAIALNPNYALAHHWYSLVLEAQGRLDEALAQIDQAIQLDPLSVAALSTRFRYLFSAGRLAEALPTYENKVLALRQDYFFSTGEHAQALLASGRREKALAVARSICARESMEVRYVGDGLAVYVLRALGHEAEAAAHVERLLPRLPADSYLRGVALASLDRLDEAMPFLERTPPGLTEIFYWNPTWDRWRDDPRFVRLMAKLNCTEEYKVARATLARMQQAQAAKK